MIVKRLHIIGLNNILRIIFLIRLFYAKQSLILLLFLTLSSTFSLTQAQSLSSNNQIPNVAYTEKTNKLLQNAQEYLHLSQPEKALSSVQDALHLSQKNNYLLGKAESLSLLGKINKTLRKYSEALKDYLWAIQIFETINEQQRIAQEYREVGCLYLDMNAYKKAEEYFLLFQKTTEKFGGKINEQINFFKDLAFVHLQLKEYEESKNYYALLLEEYKKKEDTLNLEKTFQTLANISKINSQYEEAILYHQKLLTLYKEQKNIVKITNTYNNIGFLYKRKNDLKTSLEYFNNGISISQKNTSKLDEESQVALFTNIGIAYTNLSLFARAKEYYLQALKIRERQENPEGKAYIHNHLASNYLISGKNALALKSVMTAIDIGMTYDAKDVLATSYKILAMIYESDKNLSKAQLYLNKYNEIRENLETKSDKEYEEMLRRQKDIEGKEDDIKALLREQEQNALEQERNENELMLKEKELAILKRDQELQAIALQNKQLEKEKAEQALALARQQLQAEKKDRKLKELEKQKQLQDLRLKQQVLEKEQQEKAIALLEADKKLKEQKLREEASLRKYGYGVLILFMFILGITTYSFIQKRNDNKKLKKHQKEIQNKNRRLLIGEKELRQHMERLKATQYTLAKQKEQLEVEYKKTQESIEYARKIQFSILPTIKQLKSIIPDSFILYKPKDIVSGDFYWVSKNEEKIIVSVVDCTGHGVPGALVSLIGNNVLHEAVNEHQLTNPGRILQYMDQGVQKKLRQEEEEIKDGMDLGLCILEAYDRHSVKLTYSGAKNTLYVVTNGELVAIKGDRKSIGGSKGSFEFSTKELQLRKGDVIYLTTDGFIDQANPNRERFGSKRLKMLIEEVHQVKMMEQKGIFEKALAAHQQNTEQRDDINLIGIRL